MNSTGSVNAVRSMTAYAQARLEKDGQLLRVSIRSVNHRFLDVRVRMPEGFDALESRIRQLLRDRLRRGHVEVTVHFDAVSRDVVQVNRNAAESYLRAIASLRTE